MKKSILIFVAFILLGLSFAKAQIQEGMYMIVNEKTKKALICPVDGLLRQVAENPNEPRQKWRIETTQTQNGGTVYKIRYGNNGVEAKYITLTPSIENIFLQNVPVYGDSHWRFEKQSNGNYCIYNNRTNTFIDVPRGKSDENLAIIHFKGNRDDNQRWILKRIGN